MAFWRRQRLVIARSIADLEASADFSGTDFDEDDFRVVASRANAFAEYDMAGANRRGVGIRAERGLERAQAWATPRTSTLQTELEGRRLTGDERARLAGGSYVRWNGPGDKPRWVGRINEVAERPDAEIVTYGVDAVGIVARLQTEVPLVRVPRQRVDQAIQAAGLAAGLAADEMDLQTAVGEVLNFGTFSPSAQQTAAGTLFTSAAGRDIPAGESITYTFTLDDDIVSIDAPRAPTNYILHTGSVTVQTSSSGPNGTVVFTATTTARISQVVITGKTIAAAAVTADVAPRENAWTLILQAFAIEGPSALLDVDRLGRLVFRSRRYLTTAARAITPQYTLKSTPSAGEEVLISRPTNHDSGVSRVINQASIVVLQRASSEAQLLHASPAGRDIPAGQSIIYAFLAESPITSISPLVEIDNYIVHSGEVTVSTSFAGRSGQVVFTAVGINDARISQIQVFGQVEVLQEVRITDRVNAADSIRDYDARPAPSTWSPWPELSVLEAQTLCDSLVQWWRNPRRMLTVSFWNRNQASEDAAHDHDIGARIAVVLTTDVEMDARTYYIEGMIQEQPNVRELKTTIEALAVDAEGDAGQSVAWGAAVWGTSQWSA